MSIKISRCKWALTACFLLVFITCSLVFPNEITASEAEMMERYDREVLILQSYNRDFVHANDQELGILEVFEKSPERIRFHYEFLDTKNYISDEYLAVKYEEFAMKYGGRFFDAIILNDNDALNFYHRYGKKLWPDTRNVVATGINSVSHYPSGVDGVIIIEERFEYKKNIDLALMQCKDQEIKRLNFIYDDSTTSREIIKDIEALTKEQYPDYTINHYFDKTPEELRTIVDASDSHDLFFLTIYFQSIDGRYFTYNEVPIHIFARITAVADVYDALRSNRVYKKAWPKADSEAYILDHKGVFFDPLIVSIFEDSLDTISKIFEELADDELLV